MTGRTLSLRAASIAAAALIGFWFVYISVGWAVAPGVCAEYTFHVASGGMLLAAIVVLVLAGLKSRPQVGEGGSDQLHAFVRLFWLRLAGLFVAGMALAWILATVWC